MGSGGDNYFLNMGQNYWSDKNLSDQEKAKKWLKSISHPNFALPKKFAIPMGLFGFVVTVVVIYASYEYGWLGLATGKTILGVGGRYGDPYTYQLVGGPLSFVVSLMFLISMPAAVTLMILYSLLILTPRFFISLFRLLVQSKIAIIWLKISFIPGIFYLIWALVSYFFFVYTGGVGWQ